MLFFYSKYEDMSSLICGWYVWVILEVFAVLSCLRLPEIKSLFHVPTVILKTSFDLFSLGRLSSMWSLPDSRLSNWPDRQGHYTDAKKEREEVSGLASSPLRHWDTGQTSSTTRIKRPKTHTHTHTHTHTNTPTENPSENWVSCPVWKTCGCVTELIATECGGPVEDWLCTSTC